LGHTGCVALGGGAAVTSTRNQVAALGLRVVAAIAIVWIIFDLTGFGAACDDLLRKQFYAMRGDRPTKQRVILVTLDANTISAWGQPPWRADKINAMFAAIQTGAPRAVGIAGDPRLVMGSEPVPAGVLFDSAAGDPTVRMLQAASLRTNPDAVTNYVGKRGLPTLSAAQVASGEIPSATFAGKLVVVGVTAKPYAPLVVTPIGPLTAVQDQAQALASIADGTSWTVVPGWLRLLVIALMSLVAMIASRKAETVWALAITSSLAVGVVVLDYALFAANVALFGATSALAATWIALGFERLRERRAIRHLVSEIGVWTRQRLALASMRVDVSDEQAYWQRVARLAQLYLECTSTIVAELPAGRMRLEVRAIHGTSESQIADRELDVRKNPLRTAHLLHTHVWHDSFIAGGTTSTLLVPLVVRGKTIGFWIINFEGRPRDHLKPSHLELVRTLALELALAMDRRKQQTAVEGDGFVQRLIGRGPLATELGEIRQHVRWQTQHQQDLLALGESMPFGVFVATLWGEIRYMNTAMKQLCSLEGLDPGDTGQSLPDVLSRLTSMQSEDVHDNLRRLVHELAELHLRGRDRDDRPGHDFVLSWLKPTANAQGDAEHLLLVCALPRMFTRARPREVKPVLSMGRTRPSDDAMTVPVPKTDLSDERKSGEIKLHTRPPSGTTPPAPQLALGTPKFERPPTEDEELRNLILPTPQPGVMQKSFLADISHLHDRLARFEDEITFVERTIPMERVDDPTHEPD
jgi:GAF domain-containing protein